MKVVVLHNAYQQRGGEDVVVEAEAALLRDAGHDVHVEIVSNDGLQSPGRQIATLAHVAWSSARYRWAKDLVATHRPDVVHVHNFFPRLTPAVHVGAADAGAAVVQTLHNYRLFCANALLLRDGKPCEQCLGRSSLAGIVHRCYRGSALGSAGVVAMGRSARKPRWLDSVHRAIALTDFAKTKFERLGFAPERLVVKPNFVAGVFPASPRREGAVFIGRLSTEKGVDVLLSAWQELPDIPLTIIGEGPDEQRLRAMAPPNVRFLGALPASGVRAQLGQAKCLVMPSIWYETFGLTIIEAFAAGLPVVASRLGAMAELVRDGANGRLFEAGNAKHLAAVIREEFGPASRLGALGTKARQTYLERFTPEVNLRRLEDIYRAAIAARSARLPEVGARVSSNA